MGTPGENVKPPVISLGPLAWVRNNLFSSWFNALLTPLCLASLFFLLKALLSWAITAADWSAVTANLRLYLVGQYPPEQLWRVLLSVLLLSGLCGVTWAVWSGLARTFALVLAGFLGVMALLPLPVEGLGLELRLWLLANPALVGLGYLLTHYWLTRYWASQPRWVILSWVGWFGFTILLLRGIEGVGWLPVVGTNAWGGLLLNLLLALVGIVACFPLGVLLALGRRSNLPVVKGICVLYIELIRGVPLVTLLFMAMFIVPLFLPEGVQFDRLLRAMVAITLFSAAYMAENVRGGLQALPAGQSEAGRALGLSGRHVMFIIVLPQALRTVIPTIVGQFISLLKDTTLVVTVALNDIGGIGRSIAQGNVQWLDNQAEVFLFIALVFWVFTYSMSYTSRRLEQALGAGQR